APGGTRDAYSIRAAPGEERRASGRGHRSRREGARRLSVTRVILPKLGLTMDEGRIVAWHKREGDAVAAGDLLFEVETDKATMEVESPTAGTLRRILYPADATAPVATVIALITDTPAARKRAQELGVDIGSIPGSGPGGRVTLEDFDAAAAASKSSPAAPSKEKREPLSRMRRAI